MQGSGAAAALLQRGEQRKVSLMRNTWKRVIRGLTVSGVMILISLLEVCELNFSFICGVPGVLRELSQIFNSSTSLCSLLVFTTGF